MFVLITLNFNDWIGLIGFSINIRSISDDQQCLSYNCERVESPVSKFLNKACLSEV